MSKFFWQKLCKPEGSGMIYSKCLKEKRPAKKTTWQSFPSELKEIKLFPDEQKLKEFITIRWALQNMLEEHL